MKYFSGNFLDFGVVANKNGAFGSTSTKVTNFIYYDLLIKYWQVSY